MLFRSITVQYFTSDAPPGPGSATADVDYVSVPAPQTLTFFPGQTQATIQVTIVGDVLKEGNEIFFLNLQNPNNATVARPRGTATIIDEEQVPKISVGNVQVQEGDSGTPNSAVFRVSLSDVSSTDVAIPFTTDRKSVV